MTSTPPPPRLYCIVATHAPVAVVFRKGPNDWFHIMRWWLDEKRLEPGVWVRKRILPRRCDISADGQLMVFLMHGNFAGQYAVHAGISRVPWVHVLEQFDDDSTFSRGWTFVNDPNVPTLNTWNQPVRIILHDRSILVQRNGAAGFINERRRGWTEAPDCPPRAADDVYDEKRNVHLQKQTASGHILHLTNSHYQSEGGIDSLAPTYELEHNGQRQPLDNLYWADWDHNGRLLMATRSGLLHARMVRDGTIDITETHDLNNMTPNPQPAPEWAMH